MYEPLEEAFQIIVSKSIREFKGNLQISDVSCVFIIEAIKSRFQVLVVGLRQRSINLSYRSKNKIKLIPHEF